MKIKPKIAHQNGRRWGIEDPGPGASGPALLFVNRHEIQTIRRLINEYGERMEIVEKNEIGRLEVETHFGKKVCLYI